jgi:hypothetical protein
MSGIPPEQAPVAALLRRITGAEPVETHVSAVFVGRDEAFKLKKALRLPFLDFSTLPARERFTRRELELNRPNAPGIYREVLPVTRGEDGALRLGGAGEAVEWVLRMAPVPPGDFLDAVAARGGLDGPMLDALADAVAALLAAAPVAEGVDSPGRMAAVLEGNIAGCLEAGLDPARVEAVAAAMRMRLAALAPLLSARAAAGCVRRCHGDLHLGNLCLWEGRPVAFDALEFDEALARTDTGYGLRVQPVVPHANLRRRQVVRFGAEPQRHIRADRHRAARRVVHRIAAVVVVFCPPHRAVDTGCEASHHRLDSQQSQQNERQRPYGVAARMMKSVSHLKCSENKNWMVLAVCITSSAAIIMRPMK